MWWHELQRQPAGPPGNLDVCHSADVSSDAVLDTTGGSISIGARTRICAGAFIAGPVSIGADCLIGNLAMIRGTTTIGHGSRVGFATEVKNSLIADRVTIGPQCFVADSKIECDAYLGAQVRTSNHRLDRSTVKVVVGGELIDTGLEKLGCLIGERAALGIQVIILPGRQVSPGSVFGPRTTVEKNLPTGRYRLAQQIVTY